MHPSPGAYAPGLTKMPRLRRWSNRGDGICVTRSFRDDGQPARNDIPLVRQTRATRPAFLSAHIGRLLASLDFGTLGSFAT